MHLHHTCQRKMPFVFSQCLLPPFHHKIAMSATLPSQSDSFLWHSWPPLSILCGVFTGVQLLYAPRPDLWWSPRLFALLWHSFKWTSIHPVKQEPLPVQHIMLSSRTDWKSVLFAIANSNGAQSKLGMWYRLAIVGDKQSSGGHHNAILNRGM